ncbi:hypothetical protein [Kordia zhangzhouensis]|nr:hypothetical protein [Kordia zhangzhouensis]
MLIGFFFIMALFLFYPRGSSRGRHISTYHTKKNLRIKEKVENAEN